MAEPWLMATAAEWHERMREAPDPATCRAFETWRMGNASHAAAYDRVAHARSQAATLAAQPPLLSLRQEALARATIGRRSGPSRRIVVASAVLALAGAPLAAWTVSRWTPAPIQRPTEQSVRTAVGQQTEVTLPDGSQVTLDTASRLTIRYDGSERRVALQGQGWFKVDPSDDRPFVIAAGDMVMRAEGGTFDVRTDPGSVRALVVNGRLAAGGADGGASATIRPGELLTVTGSDAAIRPLADTAGFTGWRHGMLEFRNSRLAEVAGELNRYRRQPIRLADARAAELRISGAFATAESPAFVEALTSGFPVRVMPGRDTDVLIASR